MDKSMIVWAILYLLGTLVAIAVRGRRDARIEGQAKPGNTFKVRFKLWRKGLVFAIPLALILANGEYLLVRSKLFITSFSQIMIVPPFLIIFLSIVIGAIVFGACTPMYAAIVNHDELNE
jgi:hypothetical protein